MIDLKTEKVPPKNSLAKQIERDVMVQQLHDKSSMFKSSHNDADSGLSLLSDDEL